MSEEIRKNSLDVFEVFEQTKLTFAEAEEQAKAMAGAPRIERFRIGEDGEYTVRVLPLAPVIDADGNVMPMERHGFDYPLHQQFLKIRLPKKDKDKDKKDKFLNVPVVRATDKGVDMSIDLIDTYVKIAKEIYADDDELMELLKNSNYYGGLKWTYLHAMYILDLTKADVRKGPQLWQASHSQYMQLFESMQRLWSKERQRNKDVDSPVCAFRGAYPVSIIRKTEKKTSYTIELDRYADDLSEEELVKLLDTPRIPELIYRFTKYQLEAEVFFLQQYDEDHDMDVCSEPDFIEAVEKLKGELPKDDTSHFDIASAGGEAKQGGKEEVTIASLWAEYDAIVDAELNEKSEEYQDLREKIRQFAEDNDLDVRLSRSKNNEQLLQEVEEAFDEKKTGVKPAPEVEPEPEKEADPEPEPEKEAEEEEKKPVRARRRPRPDAEEETKPADPEPEPEKEEEPEPESEKEAEEEAPRRRLHTRRQR